VPARRICAFEISQREVVEAMGSKLPERIHTRTLSDISLPVNRRIEAYQKMDYKIYRAHVPAVDGFAP